ncbi:MAG: hypothetical protein WA003_11530, partial [Desulfuromonadaceae bacterium]
SHLFVKKFDLKVFVINNPDQLNQAIEKLYNTDLEVMVQDIIPGNEIYVCYFYFDQKTEPLAICGYDKLRQSPPDFGNGSLCRSFWKPYPIAVAVDVLKSMKYHGIAVAEFKRDPRDGQYKMIEINARTTMQSILVAQSKVPIHYVAYKNLINGDNSKIPFQTDEILWIDELTDMYYGMLHIIKKIITFSELFKPIKGRKVFAVASLDDPAPFIVSAIQFLLGILRQLLKKVHPRL